MKRGPIASSCAVAAMLCWSAPAEARVVQDERYGAELTWNAAIRLLRVDMGFTITERDRETGFLLFTYQDSGRASPGSVEIVPAQVEGVAGCRIIISLSQMPIYAERHLFTRLARKLRDEYGEPPPAARPPPREPARSPGDRPAEGGNGDRPAEPAGPNGNGGNGPPAAPAQPGGQRPDPSLSELPRLRDPVGMPHGR